MQSPRSCGQTAAEGVGGWGVGFGVGPEPASMSVKAPRLYWWFDRLTMSGEPVEGVPRASV